jgi:hypothetical protein
MKRNVITNMLLAVLAVAVLMLICAGAIVYIIVQANAEEERLKEADDKERQEHDARFDTLNKHLKSDTSIITTQLSEIEAGTTSVDGAVKTLVAAGPVTQSSLQELLTAVNKVDVRMGSVTHDQEQLMFKLAALETYIKTSDTEGCRLLENSETAQRSLRLSSALEMEMQPVDENALKTYILELEGIIMGMYVSNNPITKDNFTKDIDTLKKLVDRPGTVTIAIVKDAFIGDHTLDAYVLVSNINRIKAMGEASGVETFTGVYMDANTLMRRSFSVLAKPYATQLGNMPNLDTVNFAQSFDKVRADIIKAAANEKLGVDNTARDASIEKIVPDWTSQKQIREMIATVEVPKTPKPVEQTEALRIEAIRNVVTRDVVNQSSTRIDGFMMDIKREMGTDNLERQVRIIGSISGLSGGKLEAFVEEIMVLSKEATSVAPDADPPEVVVDKIRDVIVFNGPKVNPLIKDEIEKVVEDVKGEPDADMIAKKMIAKNSCAGAAPKDDTAPVVTPPKVAKPEVDLQPDYDGVSQALAFVNTYVTKADYSSDTEYTKRFVKSAMVPTYIAPTFWKSTQGLMADIYDNGLVISLLSASAASYPKNHTLAWNLAGGWLSRYSRVGWDHGPANTPYPVARRIRTMNLLYARYEKNGAPASGLLSDTGYVYMQGDVRDIGNNIMLALGLFKFGTTFQHAPSVRFAYDIIAHVSATRKCENGANGYEARVPRINDVGDPSRPGGVKDHQWVAFEHHIDLLALCNGLLKFMPSTDAKAMGFVENTSVITEVRDTCVRLSNQVWKTEGHFVSGANSCEDLKAGVLSKLRPVDTNTWLAMAVIPENGLDDKVKQSLVNVIRDFLVKDTDIAPLGCGTRFKTQPDCSTVPEKDLYYGFRFSIDGYGIQWENTGAGLIALLKFFSPSDANTDVLDAIDKIYTSIVKMFKKHGSGGIPASFHDHDALIEAQNGSTTEYNTGFSWNYFKAPHTVATMYCAMAVEYYKHWKTNDIFQAELYNSYGTRVRAVKNTAPASDMEVDLTTMQEEWTDLDDKGSRGVKTWDLPPTYSVVRKSSEILLDNDHKAPLYGYLSQIQSDGNFRILVAGTTHDRLVAGNFSLVMQMDGNLVLYEGKTARYSSSTVKSRMGHYSASITSAGLVIFGLDGQSEIWSKRFAVVGGIGFLRVKETAPHIQIVQNIKDVDTETITLP